MITIAAMKHRHLIHSDLASPMCVDDVICRGLWADWVELHLAAEKSQAVRDAILQVCAPHVDDPYNQRYIFWFKNVEAGF